MNSGWSKPTWPELPTTRMATATLFRGYLTVIEKMGRLPAVRRRVRPHVAELIDRPPFPTKWLSARDHEEVIEALSAIAGDEAVVTMGHETSLNACGALIIPVAKTLMAIAGRTPATVFNRLGSLTTALLRGTSTEYIPASPTSGVVKIVTDDFAPRSNFVFWKGALQVPFDVSETSGSVSMPTLDPGGCIALFNVSWTTKG